MQNTKKKGLALATFTLCVSVLLAGCFDSEKGEKPDNPTSNETTQNESVENSEALNTTIDTEGILAVYEPLRYFSTVLSSEGYFYKVVKDNPLESLKTQEKHIEKMRKSFSKDKLTDKETEILADFDKFIVDYTALIDLRNETYRESKGRLLMNDINKESSYLTARTNLINTYIDLREELLTTYMTQLLIDETPVTSTHAKRLSDELYLISGFATTDIYAKLNELGLEETYTDTSRATKLLSDIKSRMTELTSNYSSTTNTYVMNELSNLSYMTSSDLEISVANRDAKKIASEYNKLVTASKKNIKALINDANKKSKTIDSTEDEVILGMLYLILLNIYHPASK